MKKAILVLLAGAMILSLAACSSVPSKEKIKQALDDGTITFEDAKEKGWIDDAWIDANYQVTEAGSKVQQFEPFTTAYLDGSAASSSIISGKMCLVFFSTAKEETMKKLAALSDISETMKKKGVPVLGVILDKDPASARDKLADMKFPIIVCNDGMKASLSEYSEILDADAIDIALIFTKDGGIYSAWETDVSKDSILEEAESLAKEE